jgi:hypothetical protein
MRQSTRQSIIFIQMIAWTQRIDGLPLGDPSRLVKKIK